jgi:hypothetical protein
VEDPRGEEGDDWRGDGRRTVDGRDFDDNDDNDDDHPRTVDGGEDEDSLAFISHHVSSSKAPSSKGSKTSLRKRRTALFTLSSEVARLR